MAEQNGVDACAVRVYRRAVTTSAQLHASTLQGIACPSHLRLSANFPRPFRCMLKPPLSSQYVRELL